MNNKNVLDNIKSDYFVQLLFNMLQKNISFRIVNYNKYLQKKLNISIKDFIECYDLYGPTSIEIIPVTNKYGKFINIRENEKKYYRIYFNDNKKEIKNKYSINEEDKITKINVKVNYKINPLGYLFEGCDCIESVHIRKYCRKSCSLYSIIEGCASIKELSLSDFYENEISNMPSMFCDCKSIEKININNFYNNKVGNMPCTFNGCTSLKQVNISNFYNNKADNMPSTFSGCTSLKEVNISNF